MTSAAFDQIYKANYAGMCYLAYRYVGDRTVAEDVVSDVFTAMWALPDHGSHIDNPRYYLYRSVRNRCLTYLHERKRQSEIQRELSHLHPDIPPVFTAAFAEKVEKAISSLPPRCSTVIRLAYVEHLSSAEIAKQMGITVSTVNVQRAIGISMLRKLLVRIIVILLSLF